MTTNPRTTGRRIEGWLTQPPAHTGQPSEGHASAVNVLRMVGHTSDHVHQKPMPFRAQPPRLRSIRHSEPTATRAAASSPAHGCAGAGGLCHSHPDCHDRQCQGHPDNDPSTSGEFDPALRAIFWLGYLAVVAIASVAAVYLSTH